MKQNSLDKLAEPLSQILITITKVIFGRLQRYSLEKFLLSLLFLVISCICCILGMLCVCMCVCMRVCVLTFPINHKLLKLVTLSFLFMYYAACLHLCIHAYADTMEPCTRIFWLLIFIYEAEIWSPKIESAILTKVGLRSRICPHIIKIKIYCSLDTTLTNIYINQEPNVKQMACFKYFNWRRVCL